MNEKDEKMWPYIENVILFNLKKEENTLICNKDLP